MSELTHGVTEHETGLIYDVSGSLMKRYPIRWTGSPARACWGPCSMSAPGTAYNDSLDLSIRGKIMAVSTSIPVSLIAYSIWRLSPLAAMSREKRRHLVCFADR
ncbi:MAG: hypothetical protein GPOALKHO_000151 [Sodalis sp.]|nr:MAG: hypothetical protein GPOALKHO_000151 [Sodalis sp.]